MMDIWNWLKENHEQIGALSSLVFGISTASIAVLAYRLNKKNNFGPKPLVVVTHVGGGTDKSSGKPLATFQVEIWNRRKYAIDLKMASVKFKTSPGVKYYGPWM